MTIATDAMRSGDKNFAEDVAKSLATLTEYPLDQMLSAWIARNHFWPSVIFRGAGATIRDAVISALEKGTANANHAVSALAWIGDAVVQESFRHWESNPPGWRSRLFVGPAGYAHVAGWELCPRGRRDLFHHECFGITPASTNEQPDTGLRLMREVEQSCPWCKRQLVNLIELNPADERFAFLGISGEKLSILTCDACTCFGTSFVFSRAFADGTAVWANENVRPVWLPEDANSWQSSPWKNVPIRLHARSAIHAVDWCMPVTISQIGGLPSWVQDSGYPKCPVCSDTMKFVAQIDNGEFQYHEGVYYAFLCAKCRITATTYQQT